MWDHHQSLIHTQWQCIRVWTWAVHFQSYCSLIHKRDKPSVTVTHGQMKNTVYLAGRGHWDRARGKERRQRKTKNKKVDVDSHSRGHYYTCCFQHITTTKMTFCLKHNNEHLLRCSTIPKMGGEWNERESILLLSHTGPIHRRQLTSTLKSSRRL